MDLSLYVVRFLHYTAALQLFGIAVFQVWIAPPQLRHAITDTSRRIAIASAAVLLVSGLAWLMFMAGSMGSGWTDITNLSVIGTVLRVTQFGQVWFWHLLLVALLLPIAALGLRGSAGWAALALLSTLALGSLGLIGHAAIAEGYAGLLNRSSHILHALSSGFWLGSLLPLLYSLRMLKSPELGVPANVALRKFSGLGHYAVAIALASGISNSWFILRNVEINPAVPYQSLLLLKIALVGVMLLLALVNRYVFVPRIPNNGPGARQLHDGTIAEIVVSAAILTLVAMLGVLSPS